MKSMISVLLLVLFTTSFTSGTFFSKDKRGFFGLGLGYASSSTSPVISVTHHHLAYAAPVTKFAYAAPPISYIAPLTKVALAPHPITYGVPAVPYSPPAIPYAPEAWPRFMYSQPVAVTKVTYAAEPVTKVAYAAPSPLITKFGYSSPIVKKFAYNFDHY